MDTSSSDGRRSIRVLLIDDDLAALTSLEGVLLGEFDVVTAPSALRALEIARNELDRGRPFDVVCSDFKMPEMDGVELLHRVSLFRDPPSTVLVTGYAEMLRGQQRADHVQGLLVKPYDPEHVLVLVRRLGRVTQLKRSIRKLGDRAGVRRAW